MKSGGGGKIPTRMTSAIEDLPDNVLINIISLLGMKSAKRCSAVCKAWYRVLKDEARYMERCYANSFALLSNATVYKGSSLLNYVMAAGSEEDTVGCPRVVRGGGRHKVVGCCNDVLLCRDFYSAYFVWEPLTGNDNWVQLPPVEYGSEILCGIACHEDGSFTVIHISDCIGGQPTQCLPVYTFSNYDRSWVWKKEQMCWPEGRMFRWRSKYLSHGVMYKGFMFWLGEACSVFGVADPYHAAAAATADDDGGTFSSSSSSSSSCVPRFIDLPAKFGYMDNESLVICREKLTIVQMSIWPSPCASISIWILHDDDDCSWSLHKRVSLQPVFEQPPVDIVGDPSSWDLLQERVELLGCHPYDHNVVYFRVWETVFSLDTATMTLQQLFRYYPYGTYFRGIAGTGFTYKPQWRPTPILAPTARLGLG